MSSVVIDEGRVARLLAEAHLRAGSGRGANGTIDVCIMQAVDWIAGGDGKSDAPSCVDPVIRAFCIRLNDAGQFGQWRDELKPFAARLANTNAGEHRDTARLWAQRLRDVAPVVDKASALAGRDVAQKAASAASAAYAADARFKADARKRSIWDQSLALLERLIAVTEVPVAV